MLKRRRNDSRTADIMIAMSTRLNELLLDENVKNLFAAIAAGFAAIAAGRTDYENMLPMTLGVCKAA